MMENEFDWGTAQIGEPIWVSDPDAGYVEGIIKEIKGQEACIEYSGRGGETISINNQTGQRIEAGATAGRPYQRVLRKLRTGKGGKDAAAGGAVPNAVIRVMKRSPTAPPPGGVEDLDELPVLNEAEVLAALQLRFRMDRIYTRTGPLLIAANPFKWLPIYSQDAIDQYHRAWARLDQLPPHAYAVAERTYRALAAGCTAGGAGPTPQVMIICGESGAGKTETTKLMLQYLAVVAGKEAPTELESQREEACLERGGGGGRASGGGGGRPPVTLGDRMVQSNPLMEAFGNAQTVRNNNSSRFGKFTSYCFSSAAGQGGGLPGICGGEVSSFLLEKSRVARRPPGERNFHVFYQLCAGAGEEERALFELPDEGCRGFRYLGGGGEVAGVDDAQGYAGTLEALEAVGLFYKDQVQVMKAAAAVLHLGEARFRATEGPGDATAPVSSLKTAARLLGVDAQALGQGLVTYRRALPGGQQVASPLDAAGAADARDALAKELYARLFDWLVAKVNEAFGETTPHIIGVLDIFGFENLDRNGFEQLFINYTNEQLQHLFNQAIFRAEAEEYDKENISWDQTDFPDNRPCLELLGARPLGLLPFLDAECARGAAAGDGALVRKWHRAHAQHPAYAAGGLSSGWRHADGARSTEADFVVRHFAGPVVYASGGFVGKNRDALLPHLHDLLAQSEDPLVRALFPRRTTEGEEHAGDDRRRVSLRAGRRTVAGKFQAQLRDLLGALSEAELRFVRCVKTDPGLRPATFDRAAVLDQLRCGGVFAALEVRKAGFPARLGYTEFAGRFRPLRTAATDQATSEREVAETYLAHPRARALVGERQYRFGVSKLFFQADVLQRLEDLREELVLPFARRLQHWWLAQQKTFLQHKLRTARRRLAGAAARAREARAAPFRPAAAALGAARAAAEAVEALGEPDDGRGDAFRRAINTFARDALAAEQAVEAVVAARDEEGRNRAQALELLDNALARLRTLERNAGALEEERYDTAALWTEIRGARENCEGLRREILAAADRINHEVGRKSDLGCRASLMIKKSFNTIGDEGASRSSSGRKERLLDLPAPEELARRLERAEAAAAGADRAAGVFQALWAAKGLADRARARALPALGPLAPLLETAEAEAKAEGVFNLPHVECAFNDAWEAYNMAEKTLQGIDHAMFDSAVGLAKDAFEEASALCQKEICAQQEREKRAELKAQAKVLEAGAQRVRDAARLADLLEPSYSSSSSLDGGEAAAAAVAAAPEPVRALWAALAAVGAAGAAASKALQGGGGAGEEGAAAAGAAAAGAAAAGAAAAAVAAFREAHDALQAAWAQARGLKDRLDRDRAAKALRLRPALERAAALAGKLPFTPLLDAAAAAEALGRARRAAAAAEGALAGWDVAGATAFIDDALELSERAEEVFEEQAHKKSVLASVAARARRALAAAAERAARLGARADALLAAPPPPPAPTPTPTGAAAEEGEPTAAAAAAAAPRRGALPPAVARAAAELEGAIGAVAAAAREARDPGAIQGTLDALDGALAAAERSVEEAQAALARALQQREASAARLAELASRLGRARFRAEEAQAADTPKVAQLVARAEGQQAHLRRVLSEAPDLAASSPSSPEGAGGAGEAARLDELERLLCALDTEVEGVVRRRRAHDRERQGAEGLLSRAEALFRQAAAFVDAAGLGETMDEEVGAARRRVLRLRAQFDHGDVQPSSLVEPLNQLLVELEQLDGAARARQQEALGAARAAAAAEAKAAALAERADAARALAAAEGPAAAAAAAPALEAAAAKRAEVEALLRAAKQQGPGAGVEGEGGGKVASALEELAEAVQALEDACHRALDCAARGGRRRARLGPRLEMAADALTNLRARAAAEGLLADAEVARRLAAAEGARAQLARRLEGASDAELAGAAGRALDGAAAALAAAVGGAEAEVAARAQRGAEAKRAHLAALAALGEWARRHAACAEQARAWALHAAPGVAAAAAAVEAELAALQRALSDWLPHGAAEGGAGEGAPAAAAAARLEAVSAAVGLEERAVGAARAERRARAAAAEGARARLPPLLARLAAAEAAEESEPLVGELAGPELEAARAAAAGARRRLATLAAGPALLGGGGGDENGEDVSTALGRAVDLLEEKVAVAEVAAGRHAQAVGRARAHREELSRHLSALDEDLRRCSRELAAYRARALHQGLGVGGRGWRDLAWFDEAQRGGGGGEGGGGPAAAAPGAEARVAQALGAMAAAERDMEAARSSLYIPMKEWLEDGAQAAMDAVKKADSSMEAARAAVGDARAAADEEARGRLRQAAAAEALRGRLARAAYTARRHGDRDDPALAGAFAAAKAALTAVDALAAARGRPAASEPCLRVAEAKVATAERLAGASARAQDQEAAERAVALEKASQASTILASAKAIVGSGSGEARALLMKEFTRAEHTAASVSTMAASPMIAPGPLLVEAGRALREAEAVAAAAASLAAGELAAERDGEGVTNGEQADATAPPSLTDEDIRLMEAARPRAAGVADHLQDMARRAPPAPRDRGFWVPPTPPVPATEAGVASSFHYSYQVSATAAYPMQAAPPPPPAWAEDQARQSSEYMGRTATAFEAMAANMHFLTKGLLEISQQVQGQAALLAQLSDGHRQGRSGSSTHVGKALRHSSPLAERPRDAQENEMNRMNSGAL